MNFQLFGQAPPPAMAMPSESNKQLIDSLIKIAQYEQYVVNYAEKKVINYAIDNNWNKSLQEKTLKSIDFYYFESTIYNFYAFYTREELMQLINCQTMINNNSNHHFPTILINFMVQNNLELFVQSVIEGKYLKN